MERGAASSRYQRHPDPTFGLRSDQLNDLNPTGDDPCQNLGSTAIVETTVAPPAPCMVREQDQYMPIANVIRIMRRILPAHAKISDDAKETIQECVSEYISFVTSEANERCQREQRKTITAEDVLWAMGKLGFDDYVEPLTMFLNRYREFESDRGTFIRAEPPFKPGGFHAGPAGGGPFGYGMLDPSMLMGGYYPNGPGQGGGPSSSQSGMPVYDPFGQFK